MAARRAATQDVLPAQTISVTARSHLATDASQSSNTESVTKVVDDPSQDQLDDRIRF